MIIFKNIPFIIDLDINNKEISRSIFLAEKLISCEMREDGNYYRKVDDPRSISTKEAKKEEKEKLEREEREKKWRGQNGNKSSFLQQSGNSYAFGVTENPKKAHKRKKYHNSNNSNIDENEHSKIVKPALLLCKGDNKAKLDTILQTIKSDQKPVRHKKNNNTITVSSGYILEKFPIKNDFLNTGTAFARLDLDIDRNIIMAWYTIKNKNRPDVVLSEPFLV